MALHKFKQVRNKCLILFSKPPAFRLLGSQSRIYFVTINARLRHERMKKKNRRTAQSLCHRLRTDTFSLLRPKTFVTSLYRAVQITPHKNFTTGNTQKSLGAVSEILIDQMLRYHLRAKTVI